MLSPLARLLATEEAQAAAVEAASKRNRRRTRIAWFLFVTCPLALLAILAAYWIGYESGYLAAWHRFH